jgi:hypothetical protein
MPDTEKARSVLEREALDYRDRAEELRTIGECTERPGPRRILLDLANEADQVAARLEERLRALKPPSLT